MIKYMFYIIGVGGTGSLLARDLPKLLIGTSHEITLVDGDIVEENNMVRQSYQKQDIGDKKADILSKKINTFYSCDCRSINTYLMKDELIEDINKHNNFIPVIIGCVDNDSTRKILERTFNEVNSCVYLDSANSEFEGNIYVAIKSNNKHKGVLRSSIYDLQNDKLPTQHECTTQISKGNLQYLITNNNMAASLLEHCFLIINKKIRTGVTHVKQLEKIHR